MSAHVARALVVSAHPDDIEFGCGGTVARWADEGTEVTLCIATDGSTGTQKRELMGERLAELRRKESEAAAEVMGAREVVWLGYRDGYVEYSLELRRDIARTFRRCRPHRFVVMDPAPTIEDRFVNHPDHRAVASAALDTIVTAGTTPGHFPELLDEGLEPWRGLRELWIMGPGVRPVLSDISATISRKLEALLSHRSQIGEDSEQIVQWVKSRTAELGKPAGYEHAEAFQVIREGPGFHADAVPDELEASDLAPPPADPRAAPPRRREAGT